MAGEERGCRALSSEDLRRTVGALGGRVPLVEFVIVGVVVLAAIAAYLLGRRSSRSRSGRPASLAEMLTSSPPVGPLGETSIKEALERHLSPGSYELQKEFSRPDGRVVRADAVVWAGDSMIPIDSKFVVEPFRQLGATRDDPRLHNQARAKFRQNLKKIIDEVADKYIRPGEDTYDFAFLFVPSEVVYHEVISDEGIMDRARERSVVLASPQGLGTYLDVVERAQRALKLDERAADTVGRIDQIRRDHAPRHRAERTSSA